MTMDVQLDTDFEPAVEYGLYVTDTERSLGFYRDTIGCEVFGQFSVPGAMRATALRLGGSCLKLVEYESGIEAKNPPGKAVGFRYATFHVRDVEAAVRACEEAGYEVDAAPVALEAVAGQVGACTYAFVLDPDGNRVELCHGSPWVEPA
jgi:catechol 2,3-dioxygenase-like lactoylglutathione lyase family enzyme